MSLVGFNNGAAALLAKDLPPSLTNISTAIMNGDLPLAGFIPNHCDTAFTLHLVKGDDPLLMSLPVRWYLDTGGQERSALSVNAGPGGRQATAIRSSDRPGEVLPAGCMTD